MKTEDELRLRFGEEGLKNLKAHAELLNMSLATFVLMANFNPSELARQLQSSIKVKQQSEGE
jgi:hypothetical protein